ncbi:hypothetical protein FOZ63_026101 [Perkinsus olseni]|uniref:Peptidase A1 domain-containing protein n=1 Tax=Perkinsus olseni TaxID=32597 RepID=A0A7J6RQP3_PEROL|nr:hypothetical protein FOZ63_026101 [Perkinsus olseni]
MILQSALSWSLVSTSTPLSLPIKNNYVELTFDDQPLNLLVDSGSSQSYLVYGGWYESVYGRGSCKYLISGCYFCPPTDPCDLVTLLGRVQRRASYGDGHTIDYAMRNVTLKVAERETSNFQIGLMVGNSRVERGVQPYGLIGLSLPRSVWKEILNIEESLFLEQLVRAGLIHRTVFSVHASEVARGMSGQLVLGDFLTDVGNATLIPLAEANWTDAFVVVASSVRMRTVSSGEVMESSSEQQAIDVAIDTGSCVTTVPKEVFRLILQAIETELGWERTGWASGAVRVRQKLDAYIGWDGYIWVRRSVIERLPVIVIQVGAESSFDVHLSKHVYVCREQWCKLFVSDRLLAGRVSGSFVLGRPFFVEYDVSVDFDGKVVGLATPGKPVLSDIISWEMWRKSRPPRCKRTFKRRSGIAGLWQRCLGMPLDD